MNESTMNKSNLFWNLTRREMTKCFDGLLEFYGLGYLSDVNPLTPYAEKYKEQGNPPGVHLTQMEPDLLFAMAYNSYMTTKLADMM